MRESGMAEQTVEWVVMAQGEKQEKTTMHFNQSCTLDHELWEGWKMAQLDLGVTLKMETKWRLVNVNDV